MKGLKFLNGYFDFENPDKITKKGKSYKEYDDFVSIVKKKNFKDIIKR